VIRRSKRKWQRTLKRWLKRWRVCLFSCVCSVAKMLWQEKKSVLRFSWMLSVTIIGKNAVWVLAFLAPDWLGFTCIWYSRIYLSCSIPGGTRFSEK
jgi:hypothetical protein